MSVLARRHFWTRPAPPLLVIYDCDGVLIDSETIADRLVADEMTRLGWEISAEECGRRFLGITYGDMCPMIEAELGRALPDDWLARFLARVVETMAREAEPVPGARAALEATTALGLEWRVASNSSHAEMAAKFTRVAFLDLVTERMHSAQDVLARGGKAKPAPDLFLAVAASVGVDPVDCVVVEDSPTGIRAAVAAGMTCLAYSHHGDPEMATALGAAPFQDMHELPDLLRHALAGMP